MNGQPYIGNGQFKFALVDAAGTTTYWSHDGSSSGAAEPSSSVALPVVDGKFTAVLGDTQLANMSELPPTVFANTNVHARVWFSDGNHPFQHLTPDEALVPAAYAMMSAQVAAGAVGPAQLADGAVTASKLAPGSVTPTALADGAVISNLGKSGGLVVSTSPSNTVLLESGYQKIGSTQVEGESWRSLERVAPPPRVGHRAFWTGSEMVIVGGNPVDTQPSTTTSLLPGFRFDPRRATWSALPTNNAPRLPRSASSPTSDAYEWRIEWTGTEIFAWNLRSRIGAKCDPRGTAWQTLSPANSPPPRTSAFTVLTPQGWFLWGGWSVADGGGPLQDGGLYNLESDTWTPLPTNGAPKARSSGIALWTGTNVLIIGGQNLASDSSTTTLNDTWSYDPVAATWTRLHSGTGQSLGFLGNARVHWTGKEAIVYGAGGSSGGMKFDQEARRWTKIAEIPGLYATLGGASTVWTGKEMLLWGGTVANELNQRGFAYDPSRDIWREFTNSEAPAARQAHSAVWTGSQMIVWGGSDGAPTTSSGNQLGDGGIYRPADDRWIPLENPQTARHFAKAVWTGVEVLVWTGSRSAVPQSSTSTIAGGYRLNPKTGQVRALSKVNAPTARVGACVVWTGKHLIVWGGFDTTINWRDRQQPGTGSRYDPDRDQWSAITTDGAPSVRGNASAVWTGSEMIIWGGAVQNGGSPTYNNGARYSPSNNEWRPMSTTMGLVPLAARSAHTAVWTGREMLVWGDGTNGLRYLPNSDTWSSISLKDAPSPSANSFPPIPSAIWTDYGMLAWGGKWGLYDPYTDTWRVIPQSQAPVWTSNHPMVSTGSEVLIWNGTAAGAHRYDPVANTWNRITTNGAPSSRTGHSLVWIGDAMVVVGGFSSTARIESLTQSTPIYARTQPLYIYSGLPNP
ncbi:MAG: hypothetical protein JNK85_01555 [Verrucomicrobiales bacterium]|nr:hypothetical protein [Verrucomicrobiales bacterium]